MKRWTFRAILAAALLALGLWGWHLLFPSPEQVIRKRLTELAQAVSFSAKEAPLAKLANAQNLTAFLASDVEITVDVPGQSRRTFSGRDELVEAAIAARSVVGSLSVQFFDINVSVAPDKQTAIVNLTARGKVPGEDLLVQELKFLLKKIGHDWMIIRVETVKTLS